MLYRVILNTLKVLRPPDIVMEVFRGSDPPGPSACRTLIMKPYGRHRKALLAYKWKICAQV